MKSRYLIIIITAVLTMAGSSFHAEAQNHQEDWRQKIKCEKIAFITTETGISPEEAQAFWPVYNKVNKERDEAMHAVFRSYKDLNQAIEENRSAKEIGTLLDKYLKAQEEQRKLDNNVADEYKKVLPVEKVAKVFIAEEKFRRQHIHRLRERKSE